MPLIAIALLIAAALGGGTAVAAQSSLPTDALWGFKTAVNENVQGALAIDEQAKAQWDINLAAARLDEAQKLAAQGSLSADAKAKIMANFDEHAQDVADRIAKLQAQGKASLAAQIATQFQSTLATRAMAFTNASTTGEVDADLSPIVSDVRGTLDAATHLSADASAKAQVEVAEHEDNATSSNEQGDDNTNEHDGGTASVHVNTGTSVRGGEGGLKTDSETGATIGI